ncbi:hypothetical protein BGZ57DRAFT_549078 [Hyaloscypha finlandica]|nr:hypothetical protein BGZ57DRAFT_549078 [Hyaloscypha finlandica]
METPKLTHEKGSCLAPHRSNSLTGSLVLRERQDFSNVTHGLGGNTTNIPLAVDVAPLNPAVFTVQPYSGLQNFTNTVTNRTVLQNFTNTVINRTVLQNFTNTVTNRTVFRRSGPPPISWNWQNQGGVSWLATIQNQGPCGSCWAFASAALVETQVRIEQGYWDKRSEGDIRDGLKISEGKTSADFCNGDSATSALDWVVKNGVTDLQCFPSDSYPDQYNPCVDRDGRTTRIPEATPLAQVDEKNWIANIGPIITWLNVDYNFWINNFTSSEVYYSPPSPTYPPHGGAHFVLIVGYNDDLGAWIIRNSWSGEWGNNGYALLGYGQLQTDTFAKIGLQYADPDPWIKRRLHNGNMIVSGDGATHKNFELIRCTGSGLLHQWRQGGENGDWSWHDAEDISISTACVGMPSMTGTTYNRNFEFVYWEDSGYLRHKYFDQSAQQWFDGGEFTDGTVSGYPGLIQGNYLNPGNFEVIVRHNDGSLRHWYRQNGDWQLGGIAVSSDRVMMSGPSLVQGNVGAQGNFYVVVVMNDGSLKMFWRNNDENSMPWLPGEDFGSGFGATPPVMIQSNYWTQNEASIGNFELLIAKNGQVEHWRRDNSNLITQDPQDGTSGPWEFQASFGTPATGNIKYVWSLLQGPFYQNMEAIVELDDGLGTLQHWYWVADAAQWNYDTNLPS